jgi:predicted ribosomally synthesized peptide with nif11-like leader
MASEGLRALIARANNDKEFLRQLLTDPEAAIKAGGFELSSEEIEAVRSQYQGQLTDEQLENRVSKAWFRVGP